MTTATIASRPSHVPPSAVFDFDIFNDEALLRDPHERSLVLTREAPPLRLTARGGCHVIRAL